MLSVNIRCLKYLKTFFLHFVLLLFYMSIQAQTEGVWVECSGEAVIHNITPEDAKLLAKQRARLNAIEKVCGIRLQAETLVHNFVQAGDFIHSVSYGHVVDEKNIRWDTSTIEPENENETPVISLRVVMQAKVIPVDEQPDPQFKVQMHLNKKIFGSGDEVIFNIKPTMDCFIYIISIAANDSVYLLFPSIYFSLPNHCKAHEEIEIPSQTDRESGRRIRVSTVSGHESNSEIVTVIATKRKMDFMDEFENQEGFGLLGTPRAATLKLAKILSQIPISERCEATSTYIIHSK